MERERDVRAFDRRAGTYDQGPLGRWHLEVVARVARLTVQIEPAPRRTVDVGCGTGTLLAEIDRLAPGAGELAGVDPAPAMLARAADRLGARAHLAVGTAEDLPWPDAHADLVVSCVSFDHWSDQQLGLRECARVLRPSGHLILADLIAPWLWPTTVVGRRGRARTPRQVERLLRHSGLTATHWRPVNSAVRAVVARPDEHVGGDRRR